MDRVEWVTRNVAPTEREQVYQRISGFELGNRSKEGPVVYAVVALFLVLGTPLRIDYPGVSVAVLLLLAALAAVRVWFARGFETSVPPQRPPAQAHSPADPPYIKVS